MKFSKHSQTGAILIIGLILLFALTLIGVGAMSSNLLQLRMAANMSDVNTAFNAADTALRARQRWLARVNTVPVERNNCSGQANCIALRSWLGANWWQKVSNQQLSWWRINAMEYGAAGNKDLNSVSEDPRTIMEYVSISHDMKNIGETQQKSGIKFYRITAYGVGETDVSKVILQQTISKRFN